MKNIILLQHVIIFLTTNTNLLGLKNLLQRKKFKLKIIFKINTFKFKLYLKILI